MPRARFDHITLWPVSGLSKASLSTGLSTGLSTSLSSKASGKTSGGSASGTTTSKMMLTPWLHLGLEPDKGRIDVQVNEDDLDLTISTGDTPPAFVEMGWSRKGRRLAAYSHMILHLTVSARSPNTVMPAFRLHRSGGGFSDVFTPTPIVTTPEPHFHERRISLAPAALKAASRLDLMLFFAPRAGQITLHEFSLTALQ